MSELKQKQYQQEISNICSYWIGMHFCFRFTWWYLVVHNGTPSRHFVCCICLVTVYIWPVYYSFLCINSLHTGTILGLYAFWYVRIVRTAGINIVAILPVQYST